MQAIWAKTSRVPITQEKRLGKHRMEKILASSSGLGV
jgi:hypothetical protein